VINVKKLQPLPNLSANSAFKGRKIH